MPAAARGNGVDSVFSKTGTGRGCRSPVTTATAACSEDVFAIGVGIVRFGDVVATHAASGCSPDTSTLSSASNTVFINSRRAGRIGDQYSSDNTIISGSPTVFIGG